MCFLTDFDGIWYYVLYVLSYWMNLILAYVGNILFVIFLKTG